MGKLPTDTERLDFYEKHPDLVHSYGGHFTWSRRMSIDPAPSVEPPYPDPEGNYHDTYQPAKDLRDAIDNAMEHHFKRG